MRRSKSVLLDCSLAGLFFLLVTTLTCQTALAGTPGLYYVVAGNNNPSCTYDGAGAYQTTASVSVYSQSAVYSFVAVVRSTPPEQFAIGTIQGQDPGGNWLSNPCYYVDRIQNGILGYWQYGQATVGENHYYYVFCDGTGTQISAGIDSTIKKTETGYYAGTKIATGQTEAHNTDDVMNHHFWGAQAKYINRWLAFHDTQFHHDNPFVCSSVSSAEWYATR